MIENTTNRFFPPIISMTGMVLFMVLTSSCGETSANPPEKNHFAYHLDDEDASFTMPKSLIEISGLAYAEKNKLYCIEDEDGVVFLYDLEKKKIIDKIHFAGKNDYEGIALANEEIVVLKSDGTLYFIKNFSNKEDLVVDKVKTPLNRGCNAEGITFDPANNRLLIACKAGVGNGMVNNNQKAVYTFELDSKKMAKKPIFLIDMGEIQKLNAASNTFNPSGIAIHPFTDDIYILSSKGKILVVLSSGGTLKNVLHLSKKKFKQPEGIAFGLDGTMYLSNEGRKGKANIKVFTYNPKT